MLYVLFFVYLHAEKIIDNYVWIKRFDNKRSPQGIQ